MASPKVAIVGGGLSGALAALVLRSRGLTPTLFDAGKRATGGRLAGGARHPDSGLQFLTASDPRFISILGMLTREGLVAPWKARFGVLGMKGGGFLPAEVLHGTPIGSMMKEDGQDASIDFCNLLARGTNAVPLYCGFPSNASIVPGLLAAAGVEVRSGAKVSRCQPLPGAQWRLDLEDLHADDADVTDDAGPATESFDALVLATHDASLAASAVSAVIDSGIDVPSDVQDRLSELASNLRAQKRDRTDPVFTWSGYFPRGFSASVPFDAATVPGSSVIRFLARDASKPGRPPERTIPTKHEELGELWTAVSTPAFAKAVLQHADAAESGDSERGGNGAKMAQEAMTSEMNRLFQPYHSVEASAHLAAAAKRWGAGFAADTLQLQEECIGLEPWRLAICGDYIAKPKGSPAEAAALSGMEAAERVALWFADSV